MSFPWTPFLAASFLFTICHAVVHQSYVRYTNSGKSGRLCGGVYEIRRGVREYSDEEYCSDDDDEEEEREEEETTAVVYEKFRCVPPTGKRRPAREDKHTLPHNADEYPSPSPAPDSSTEEEKTSTTLPLPKTLPLPSPSPSPSTSTPRPLTPPELLLNLPDGQNQEIHPVLGPSAGGELYISAATAPSRLSLHTLRALSVFSSTPATTTTTTTSSTTAKHATPALPPSLRTELPSTLAGRRSGKGRSYALLIPADILPHTPFRNPATRTHAANRVKSWLEPAFSFPSLSLSLSLSPQRQTPYASEPRPLLPRFGAVEVVSHAQNLDMDMDLDMDLDTRVWQEKENRQEAERESKREKLGHLIRRLYR